ncbi:TPA: hypothetical protein DIS56_03205 [Candidatus Saccharibacteria bacterium]|nr:MAG: hypothetical protein UX30_C0002G0019 [Candidatus Saccharibacteria bacterium GW2011_GWA2_46_10]OGL35806.1 MAG: hypothetical protein A3F05_02115 [Candidatus Saccharibacteria bacterium RIFCSPHIGHO2_12_FULL_47_17]HCM52110.1 hypothetical protein [Candidatus Saccharibacteria bacterium]
MKVSFKKSLKLLGIGVSPFSRLGPQLWFGDYKIAAYYGWDIADKNAPPVVSLANDGVELQRLNTQSLLNNADFQQRLVDEYKNRHVLTYKPLSLKIPPPVQKAALKFLGTNLDCPFYENKALFRQEFGKLLPFPPFVVKKLSEIESLADIQSSSEPLILQHETMSGGKGTFLVSQPADLGEAIRVYRSQGSKNPKIVISQYINSALERSLQCCVTKYGTLIGPMQKQIVNAPELVNPQNLATEKFSGAQISDEPAMEPIYQSMAVVAKTVGKKLADSGYRGIFGLDFLIDKNGRLYLLEINQRLTGVTPLLTMLYRPDQDIPFLLLHILELGGADYQIDDLAVDPKPVEGSMLILHSLSTHDGKLKSSPRSGIYSPQDLEFIKSTYQLSPDRSELLFQRFVPLGSQVKAGSRLAIIYTRDLVLDSRDKLTPANQLIEDFYGQVQLE